MKQFLLIIISTVIVITSNSQENSPGCGFVKTGQFVYHDSTSNATWKITRTSNRQTEENEKTGVIIKQKIKWVSACEYKLTQTWANKKELRKTNNSWIIYKIISISGNTYYFSCNCKDGTVVAGAVVKISS